MSRESLGHFELLVLLALLRAGEEAYGVPIANAIAESTGKRVILASVYNTLERLEQKDWSRRASASRLPSAVGVPSGTFPLPGQDCERSGRPRRR
jgi:DNA-binding PadR family transcriptional regulator